MRAALSSACVIAAALLAGCGDGHSYPQGFAAEAAKGEEAFKNNSAKQAAAPRAPGLSASGSGSAGQPAADASATASATASAEGGAGLGAPPRIDFNAPPTEGSEAPAAEAPTVTTEAVVTELHLPPPPPVTTAPGEEPFQKLARDSKFDPFRAKAARYVQLRAQLLPLGVKLAEGTATPAERALHFRIEDAMAEQFRPINRYMWDTRWTELDRAAMGWILHGEDPAARKNKKK